MLAIYINSISKYNILYNLYNNNVDVINLYVYDDDEPLIGNDYKYMGTLPCCNGQIM